MSQTVLAVTPTATAVVSSSQDANESRFLQIPEDNAAIAGMDGIARDVALISSGDRSRYPFASTISSSKCATISDRDLPPR